jgi:lipopolysaccharide transport system permease protein
VLFFCLLLSLSAPPLPRGPDYAEIFMGVVLWNWFRSTTNAGMVVFLGAAGVLKQVRFPPLVLFLSKMLTETVGFGFSLGLILVVLVLFGKPVTTTWLAAPVGLVAQLLLAMAVGAWLSVAAVFLRDSLSLANFVLNLFIYVSPIVYREEMVPSPYRAWLALNPFTALMRVYRNAFIDGRPIDNWPAVLAWTSASLVVLAAGIAVMEKTKRKFYRFL